LEGNTRGRLSKTATEIKDFASREPAIRRYPGVNGLRERTEFVPELLVFGPLFPLEEDGSV
jgi:hypothetical protein